MLCVLSFNGHFRLHNNQFKDIRGWTAPSTYLIFGFWWRKASDAPWRCSRSHKTLPAPYREERERTVTPGSAAQAEGATQMFPRAVFKVWHFLQLEYSWRFSNHLPQEGFGNYLSLILFPIASQGRRCSQSQRSQWAAVAVRRFILPRVRIKNENGKFKEKMVQISVFSVPWIIRLKFKKKVKYQIILSKIKVSLLPSLHFSDPLI